MSGRWKLGATVTFASVLACLLCWSLLSDEYAARRDAAFRRQAQVIRRTR